MDKETLSNYGWIVILVLILAVMIALATPFGSFIAGAVKSTTAGFFSVNQNAMGAAGITIPGSSFEDTDGGEEGGATPVAGTPALYAEDGSIIKTWEELVDEGKVTVSGDALTFINITEGYRLLVPGTIKNFAAQSSYSDSNYNYYYAEYGFKVLEFQSGLERVTCNMYGSGDIERMIFPDTVTEFKGQNEYGWAYCWDNCYFTIEFKGNEYHTMGKWEEFNSLPECYVDYEQGCSCNWYIENGWNINIEENHKECMAGAVRSYGVIHFT